MSVSRESNWIITLTSGFFQIKVENICLFRLIKNMETSLKTGFAQIFSSCPKNLSCPKFGGAAAPLAPPAPYAYEHDLLSFSFAVDDTDEIFLPVLDST